MKIVVAAAVALVASEVSASQWVKIGKSQSGDVISVDAESIDLSTNPLKVWEQFVGPKNTVKGLVEIDCEHRTMRNLYSIVYLPNGTSLAPSNTPYAPFAPWIPDSSGEGIARVVCQAAAKSEK